MPRETVRTRAVAVVGNEQPGVRVMDGLRRVVRALSASARASSRAGGVSGAQRFVLRQVAEAPGLSVSDLVARTLSRQSTVSEVVGRLVERGMLERRARADDARQAELTLTARGRRLLAASRPTAQEHLAAGLAALPEAQLTALAEGFEAWLSAAGLTETPATMFFEEAEQEPKPRRRASTSRRR